MRAPLPESTWVSREWRGGLVVEQQLHSQNYVVLYEAAVEISNRNLGPRNGAG